jgi:aspartate/methionine/tyrosine aminotransferase
MRRTRLHHVVESPMVQIATIAESMPGSLKLCYGESDLPTPAFICDAAHEAALAGHTFYTHTAGYTELRQAIADKIFELHRVRYTPVEIMATTGATMAIYAAIRACVGAGDNAIIISPAYAIFSNSVIMAAGEPRPVPLARRGDRFQLDLDRVRASIDAGTRMIIVNSPSNPTGWVITEDEQRALVALADEFDLVLLADEVYERLIYDKPKGLSPHETVKPHEDVAPRELVAPHEEVAPSFARVETNRARLIVVNSFSKTYNMTGWRLGWAQTSEATIKTMYKAVEFMTSNPAAMTQRAGIVALGDGEPYIADLRRQYSQRRDQVTEALVAMPGVSLPSPQGAFYAFPRIDAAVDSTAFTAALVKATGVALAPGAGFGRDGEGYIRVCFASTEATITEALSRLRNFLTNART